MSTVINTPPSHSTDDGLGFGLLLGMIVVVLFLGTLFFIYGLPMLQNGQGNQAETQNIEIQVPATTPGVTASENAD